MSGKHSPPENQESPTWPDSWLTADEARAVRAEESQRATGLQLPHMPRVEYDALAGANSRAVHAAIVIRNRQRAARRKTITWLALLATIALGIVGILQGHPIPEIG